MQGVPRVHAVVDVGLGNSSYVVELGDGRAAAVDPARDPTPYLQLAERLGVDLAFTVETHLHADFVTGSRELAAHGASVLAPAAAGLGWPHGGYGDGDAVDLGGLRMQALATPGHSPEHLAWLLGDGDRPVALFSGGALLVGGAGRTDLISPERTEALAHSLWRSLHERILSLPDDVEVYPTHGAGSFCAAPAAGQRTTTIGRERATNPLLACRDEDEFALLLLAGFGSYPPYFLRLREVNRRGPRIYGGDPSLPALPPDEVRTRAAGGSVLLDVRPPEDFASAHIPGSLSITLRPGFGTWLGWVVPPDRPIVVILGEDQDRADVVRQALGVGYELLAGELAGGMRAWRAAGLPEATLPVVPVTTSPAAVLDVRQANEFAAGHLPGALNVELGSLAERAHELPPGPLAVMCGHGERAATAASLLQAAGRAGVTVVTGGPQQWRAETGDPLETS